MPWTQHGCWYSRIARHSYTCRGCVDAVCPMNGNRNKITWTNAASIHLLQQRQCFHVGRNPFGIVRCTAVLVLCGCCCCLLSFCFVKDSDIKIFVDGVPYFYALRQVLPIAAVGGVRMQLPTTIGRRRYHIRQPIATVHP